MKANKTDYDSLRTKLEEQIDFPSVYFFKFIIPADNKKLALVEALFGLEAEISIKQSSTGKYLSISAKELMLNANNIIERYKKANQIEGLMAL